MASDKQKMLAGELYITAAEELSADTPCGANVWIGAAAIILPGVTVGDDAVDCA